MKTNELRIGNWVTLHGDECRVMMIGGDLTTYHYEVVFNDGTLVETRSVSEDDSIQPIPLTEEWLEKFGFRDAGRFGFSKGRVLIYKRADKFGFGKSSLQCNFEYVHQLQNLYFALTGDELEIK